MLPCDSDVVHGLAHEIPELMTNRMHGTVASKNEAKCTVSFSGRGANDRNR